MSLDCTNKIKYLSSQHSFSSGKDVINNNFTSMKSCLLDMIDQITTINNTLQIDFPIIFPQNPNPLSFYNMIYSNGKWFLSQTSGSGVGEGANKYWILSGETLTVKARSQKLVHDNLIIEAGGNLIIEATGQLVIL